MYTVGSFPSISSFHSNLTYLLFIADILPSHLASHSPTTPRRHYQQPSSQSPASQSPARQSKLHLLRSSTPASTVYLCFLLFHSPHLHPSLASWPRSSLLIKTWVLVMPKLFCAYRFEGAPRSRVLTR